MSLAMRPNEVNTEVQYDCKVRHQAVIFLYTEVLDVRKNLAEIVFILDRSGSMSGLEADTIGGFNSMIEKQKRENGEALISTVLFDNVSEVIHDRVPVQKVEPMTDKDYSVRGCTALLDAIGGAIHHIEISISTQELRMCLNTRCSSSQRMAWRMQAAVMIARRSRK